MADEQPKRRRGKAVKSKKGEAAQFSSGDAAAPVQFDPAAIAEELNLWWENGDGQSFMLRDGEEGAWACWPESKLVKLMRSKWVRLKPREGELLSESDQVLLYVMKKRRLELSISALAGYPAGIYEFAGQRLLVRSSPKLVKPEQGEWDTVCELIESKLNLSLHGRAGPDQTSYFHSWMKVALESLYIGGPGNFQSGQCLIFAGPRDSGKSRIQHQIITGLLGGRSADPGPYLFGRTDFNGEMFSAEHVMMEDPASSTMTKDRVFFGEMLKQLVANDTQRLHRKREDAIVVVPFFRATISINDDPDKMRVLPLLTPDMKDKVMLFMCSDRPLPMPTGTLPERAAFRKRLHDELPAYAYWLLNEFAIPDDLRADRFGVRHWHHPSLATELFDDTPAAELLQVIDAAQFFAGETGIGIGCKLWDIKSHADPEQDKWEGSAIDLERLLLGQGGFTSSVDRESKKLTMHNKIDRLLSRLKEDAPERVAPHRTKMERRWIISKP